MQVCCRSFKFSLFDPAREMVYIEMGKEEKSKGKAAVDLIGSQIGKTGASWVTQALLLTTGSITAALPFTSVVFAAMLALWLRAVSFLQADLSQHSETLREEEMASSVQQAEQPQASLNHGSSGSSSSGMAIQL